MLSLTSQCTFYEECRSGGYEQFTFGFQFGGND
jgi:hypothetical protein